MKGWLLATGARLAVLLARSLLARILMRASVSCVFALVSVLAGCSAGQGGDTPGDVLCGERPSGTSWTSHVLRFENQAGDLVAQLVRRYDGGGVGESSLFGLDAFGLSIDGVTHCVTAQGSLSYTNTHHNWLDRAAVEIDGVSYELAMSYALPTANSAGKWDIDITGTRGGDVVLQKTALIRTGGPVGCYSCPAPLYAYVSELMAANSGTFADEAGEHEPWLELFNMSSDALDLSGWWLSNDLEDRKRWPFPAVTLPRNSSIVVFADGESAEGPLHTSFRLSPESFALILTRSDGVTDGGFVYQANEPDESWIFDPQDGTYIRASTPTPGARNPNMMD